MSVCECRVGAEGVWVRKVCVVCRVSCLDTDIQMIPESQLLNVIIENWGLFQNSATPIGHKQSTVEFCTPCALSLSLSLVPPAHKSIFLHRCVCVCDEHSHHILWTFWGPQKRHPVTQYAQISPNHGERKPRRWVMVQCLFE